MNQTVLITGASSGIGAAFARAYAKRKTNVVLVARRKEKLEKLAADLEAEYGITAEALVYDLSDTNAPRNIKTELDSKQIEIDILVNNAGYGVPGTFIANSWESHASANQVMVTAVMELTHILLPNMIQNNSGAIINIASIAGLIPATAGHTLYGAVKSWMIRFSEALSHELEPHNIKTVAVCPGFTYSEFHDVTGTRESVAKLPKIFWLSSEQVADMSIANLNRDRTKSNSLFVPGKFNRFLVGLNRLLPRSIVIQLLRRYAGVARVVET